MNDCKKYNKDLIAFLYGELKEERKKDIENHLDSCLHCRAEIADLEQVMKGADSLHSEIARAMGAVDWASLPDDIARSVFNKDSRMSRKREVRPILKGLLQPRFKPALAGLLAGLLLGSLMTVWMLRMPRLKPTSKEAFYVTQDFLDRVELEMARRETLDYLEKSQYVLLDFVQTSAQQSKETWRQSLASQKARDLLMKKKYINPQLEKFRLSKAKEICDQIELLFFELSQLSEELSEEDLRSIQNLIEDRQLMLKINLLKKELKESEV
ncbi:MAG: zf-HC2 domain-containing protein [Candidatus Aminicenantes bacterium]|nr:zf-HC2 domain-containing protein [Candidatus Aminicenantes bacterium]